MKLAPYKQVNYEHFLSDPGVFKWLDEVPTIRVFDIEGRPRQMVGVHAGLNPVVPTLERQDFTKCRHIRFFSPEKNKPVSQEENYNLQPAGSVFWFELYKGPKDVVFGHHSFEEVLVHTNGQGTCYGVDTGCCWGDKLSAVRFDSAGEKVISIPAHENYSQKYRTRKAEEVAKANIA
jgi:diadenosine tetraphosphatase ApaH/serine/threonine PP2A family protein phosphatase